MCFRPPSAMKQEKKCIKCGTGNPVAASVCSNCGTELPKLPSYQSAVTPPHPTTTSGKPLSNIPLTKPKSPPMPPEVPPLPPKKD